MKKIVLLALAAMISLCSFSQENNDNNINTKVMKKVLMINGSPHKEGNTYLALNEVAKQLKQNGVESEIVWIGTEPIGECIACGQCRAKELGECVNDNDVVNTVISKMNESDGLIVGSPVYYGTPTGSILSLIHRMLFAGAKVEGKPAAAVLVCRRGGATAAQQTLQMPFQMMNMPIVTSSYWNILYGRTPGDVLKDEEGLRTMRRLADNMAKILKKE